MKTLQIEESKAKELYKTASQEFKAMLEDSFGKDFFLEKITDRIKSFDDAYRIVKENYPSFLEECSLSGSRDNVSYNKLKIICKALNQDWTPNWNDSNQYKYYPYFDMRAGFGFEFASYGLWLTFSAVGSRLCFKSREIAEYAGKRFTSIYKDFLTV